MTHIETSTGFVCDIDESRMNDMELLDALRQMDRGDPMAVLDVVEKLLGEEGKTALFTHARAENGTVPMEAVCREVADIFDRLKGDGKK